jgi:hypothetical protein
LVVEISWTARVPCCATAWPFKRTACEQKFGWTAQLNVELP